MRARRQKHLAGLTEYFEVHCRPSEKVRLKYLALSNDMTMQEYVRQKLFDGFSNTGTETENLKYAMRDLKEEIRDRRQAAKNLLKRKTP